MAYTIEEARRYKLKERRKRLNIRSDSLTRRIDIIADTIFTIKAHIDLHGDTFNKERKDLLDRRIEKLQAESVNLKESYRILSSGLTYLYNNFDRLIDSGEEI